MNDNFLDKLGDISPLLQFIVMFLMTIAAVAALIGACCFAEWVGGNL